MRVALVTGAGGGIGREIRRLFAARGYRVIGTDLPSAPLEHDWLPVDLERFATDDGYQDQAIEQLQHMIGSAGLHVLVNNAALQVVGPIESLDASQFASSFAINVTAPALLVKRLLPDLERAKGAVVNIGSIHATLTKPGFACYASTKAALHGLTRALAVELGGRVRINAIAPAAIDTPMLQNGFCDTSALSSLASMHPAGVIGTAHEVASLAHFLASTDSPFLTGSIVSLDGAIGDRLHDPE